MSRLPRLLLSSWVDHKRPKQRPQFTYGHGLKRDLSNAGVDVKDWGSLAMNHNLWHNRRMFTATTTEVAMLGWMNLNLRMLLLNAFCLCRPRMRESFLGSPQQVHLTRSLLAMSSSHQQTQTITI